MCTQRCGWSRCALEYIAGRAIGAFRACLFSLSPPRSPTGREKGRGKSCTALPTIASLLRGRETADIFCRRRSSSLIPPAQLPHPTPPPTEDQHTRHCLPQLRRARKESAIACFCVINNQKGGTTKLGKARKINLLLSQFLGGATMGSLHAHHVPRPRLPRLPDRTTTTTCWALL